MAGYNQINVGAFAGDENGDLARDAFIKSDAMHKESYERPNITAGDDSTVQPISRQAAAGAGLDFQDGGAGAAFTFRNLHNVHQTLIDAATISWGVDLGHHATVTVTDDRTVGKPTNIAVGDQLQLHVIMDATGGHVLTYHADFVFQSKPILNTGANQITTLRFAVYDAGGTLKLRETNTVLAPLPVYAIADLPTAGVKKGAQAYADDDVGGGVPVFYDGTNWRRVTDRSVAAIS